MAGHYKGHKADNYASHTSIVLYAVKLMCLEREDDPGLSCEPQKSIDWVFTVGSCLLPLGSGWVLKIEVSIAWTLPVDVTTACHLCHHSCMGAFMHGRVRARATPPTALRMRIMCVHAYVHTIHWWCYASAPSRGDHNRRKLRRRIFETKILASDKGLELCALVWLFDSSPQTSG